MPRRALYSRVTPLWAKFDIGYRSHKSARGMKALCRRHARRVLSRMLREEDAT